MKAPLRDIDMARPPVPGLGLRHFGGEGDLAGMAEVANASDAADYVENVRTVAGMSAMYSALVNCDPYRDVVIAEIGQRIVGYARGWWKEEVGGTVLHLQTGFVAPAWRRRGIGLAMQRWLEARQHAIDAQLAAHPTALFNVFVTQDEHARAALLQASGFTVARYLTAMVRPDLEAIAPHVLPQGLEIRPVVPAHYRAIWQADLEAMREHWGRAEPASNAYEAWQREPEFQPDLWSVAWNIATDQVVGQVRAFVRPEENRRFGRLRGYTEFISVHPAWRGRGIARALIAHSLRGQAHLGLQESALEVDSASPSGAVQLYASCGFRAVARNMVFRKPLAHRG